MRRALLTIFGVLFLDQWLKVWIKLSRPLGDSQEIIPNFFYLHFIENPGMAFGLEFGGEIGKLMLSLFRVFAALGIVWYLRKLILEKHHPGLIFSVALIFAGAVGNIIDSAFYGLIFDKGSVWNGHYYESYLGLADFTSFGNGYAGPFKGNVVDMLYFPIIEGTFPSWMPFWGGEEFTFFRPVFNIADSAITVGVAYIILRQSTFFKAHPEAAEESDKVEVSQETDSAEGGSTQSP